MSKFLPFALPDIGEEEIAEVVDSLRSGWVTTGPKAKRFEQDFVKFLGGGVEAIALILRLPVCILLWRLQASVQMMR